MINFITLGWIVPLILLSLSFIFKKNWLYFVIPLVFTILFGLVTLIPNYEGYAVDSTFVKGRTARVLFQSALSQDSKTISVLVQFKGETDFRLVTLENTKQNKDALDNLQKDSNMDLIEFGVEPQKSESDGSNKIKVDGDGIKLIPFTTIKGLEKNS